MCYAVRSPTSEDDGLRYYIAGLIVEKTYVLSGKFPRNEQFGLTSQLRRAVVSIPSNIAEGAARNSDKEFLQFLYIALGSLAEAETQLLLATRLKFTDDASLLSGIETIRKMLLGLIKHLRGKTNV
ncbi:MAG: four helix bundle protein [Nitrospirota bacterium]|nr:four helix bundle protein [Nitrospirota bacterium]